jgi:hypothetical protein
VLVPAVKAGQRGKLEVINALRYHQDKYGKFVAALKPTAILATNPKMGNKFLHFQQVIENTGGKSPEKSGKHRLFVL